MDYKHYSIEDFAADEYFQLWVRTPDSESDYFWQNWITDHPEKRKEIEEARAIVQEITFADHQMPDALSETIWKNVSKVIESQQERTSTFTNVHRNVFTFATWARWAAVLTGFMLLSVVYFYLRGINTTVYATTNGQLRTIVLPDSSTVVLNSNSEIRYSDDWEGSADRVVELDGEAFFSVRHTLTDQKFLVKTPDGLTVEVLGTEFNVFKRKSKTRVVLNSGKVQLHLPDNQEAPKESVFMKPGELVEFNAGKQQYIHKTINPQLYTSWKDNKLILDNTSLADLMMMLEETYGLKAGSVEPSLLQLKVTGSIPVKDRESLLQLIGEAYGVTITRNNNTISVR